MNKVLVCPIAFNENVKLKNAIERFLETGFLGSMDYLVLDDASSDGTTEMIQSFAARGVKTIRHPRQMGVGAAIRTAIQYASAQSYDILVIMAGNDKDNPKEIPLLIDPILQGRADFVQGSRYLRKQTTTGDMPFYRKLATRLHPFLVTLLVGQKVTDSTNGFRALRMDIFKDRRINLDQQWLNAYELEPYVLIKAIRSGFRFLESPVTKIYPPRKLGYTKMKPVLGWWSILRPLFLLGLGIKK